MRHLLLLVPLCLAASCRDESAAPDSLPDTAVRDAPRLDIGADTDPPVDRDAFDGPVPCSGSRHYLDGDGHCHEAVPMYHYYHTATSLHYFTQDKQGHATLRDAGYGYWGIAFYLYPNEAEVAGTVPLLRLGLNNAYHFYATDAPEVSQAKKEGWVEMATEGKVSTSARTGLVGLYRYHQHGIGAYFLSTDPAAKDALSALGYDQGTLIGYVFPGQSLATCPAGWVLVPGDPLLGTPYSFCVMKYEAKNPLGWTENYCTDFRCDLHPIQDVYLAREPVSTPGELPWRWTRQPDAIKACQKIDAHLTTKEEAVTISRNIALQPTNWQRGVVGQGCLYGGHMDRMPSDSLAASPDDNDGYFGTMDQESDGERCPFTGYYNANDAGQVLDTALTGKKASRRTMVLSNGEVIWDWTGNAWEWLADTCSPGAGSEKWWEETGSYQQWSRGELDDYERSELGPANSSWDYTFGVGTYYGCGGEGYGMLRSGAVYGGEHGGIFMLQFGHQVSEKLPYFGFRCAQELRP